MAVDQNGTGNSLYLAFMYGSGGNPHYVVLCSVQPDTSNMANSVQSCAYSSSMPVGMSYNPGIAVYNGVITLGVVDAQGCLGFFQTSTLTVDLNDEWYPFQCSQTTNAATSLAIYNGSLYTAYRTGGSANTFTVATLPNFPASFGSTTPSVQYASFGMGGPGDLLPINGNVAGFSNGVLNLYTYQHKLYYTFGQ
jgi:hypothetical protein